MSVDSPDNEIPIELLAAYVDGELNGTACAQVEAWLAEHPEAYAILEDQREFCRKNADFWNLVETTEPANRQWQEVYRTIENRVIPPMTAKARRRTAWYLAPALAMSGLAAAVLLFVVSVNPRLPVGGSGSSPLSVAPAVNEDDEVFQVATADDVELIQLPEEASSLIVVGRHPMADTPLVLATTPDVDIYNLGPDDQGRMPHVEMIAGPNAAILVAQSPRQ